MESRPRPIETTAPAGVLWWAGQFLRLALGLFLIMCTLLGNDEGPLSLWVALAGLTSFGAAYAFSPSWRSVAAPMVTSALLSPTGIAGGLGAGFAIGLWLWMAFHIAAKPIKAMIQALH
jgi:hypothetical protein